MCASFKEAVIIPLSLFNKCKFGDTQEGILEGLPPDVQMKLLQHDRLLNPKGNFKGSIPRPFEIKVIEDGEKKTKMIESSKTPLNEEVIKGAVSDINKPFVQSILEVIKPRPNEISWNDKFEIILNGRLLPETNIIDLIQFFMKETVVTNDNRDVPLNAFEIYEKLLELGIPKTWIKRKPRRSALRRGKRRLEEAPDNDDDDEGDFEEQEGKGLFNWKSW